MINIFIYLYALTIVLCFYTLVGGSFLFNFLAKLTRKKSTNVGISRYRSVSDRDMPNCLGISCIVSVLADTANYDIQFYI